MAGTLEANLHVFGVLPALDFAPSIGDETP
jgi:hypothetical protein